MPHKDKEERKEYDKKYRLEHKDENKEYDKKYRLEHKEEIKERKRKYNLLHKEECKIRDKKYRLEHKDEIKVYNKKYSSENNEAIKGRVRKWVKIRYNNDPIYKRVHQIRDIFKYILLKIITNGNITAENDIACLKLFGTTVDGLKKHIENQFTGTMSWYNHGRIDNPNKWQLDHIIRIGSFDFTIEENFTKAFHYTNTRPLMSSDHIEKSNKEKGKYDK